ncbi:hypothetical protein, partial [Endozoicomonas sp. SESOKO1]|uniref:hypothetical protein n=1 Tax=Endozoicomonas sp. SESOKO1 TaxID=2828742 RepID=UPI00214817B0
MEISSSAVTSAMKVGVQIISAHKHPVLEIYHQVRNRFGPEVEYDVPGNISGSKIEIKKARQQNIFVEFTLISACPKTHQPLKTAVCGLT